MPSKITTDWILPFRMHGEKRILDAADEHRLVDHRVLDAAQAADFLGKFRRGLPAGAGVTNNVSKYGRRLSPPANVCASRSGSVSLLSSDVSHWPLS